MRSLILALILVTGCTAGTDKDPTVTATDADGDGFDSDVDCLDSNADVNPEADEICDGLDNDCDGLSDETGAVDGLEFYADSDGDGFGSPVDTITACHTTPGYVDNDDDCNDRDDLINPDATEACNDIDDDCNGLADDNAGGNWYIDADEDGFGDPLTATTQCEGNGDQVADGSDCDDTNDAVFPGASEICDGLDNDCDSLTDDDDDTIVGATTWYEDVDNDGFGDIVTSKTEVQCDKPVGYTDALGDCDDDQPLVNPDEDEVCGDGLDNDCLNGVDDDGAINVITWYLDDDDDGYGDDMVSVQACTQPLDHVGNDLDCDDSDQKVNPDTVWRLDGDDDGFGDADDAGIKQCIQPSDFHVTDGDDCDDDDDTVNPLATEICNGIDDNCVNGVDEGLGGSTWYPDDDDDGYGDPGGPTVNACSQPSDHVADNTDCDDTNGDINPETIWYLDDDDDGYGDVGAPNGPVCAQPADHVLDNTDCDDTSDQVNPDTIWYLDDDDDGFGDSTMSLAQCTQPSDYVLDDTDCNDANSDTFPGARELCDGDDNDCGLDGEPSDAWWDANWDFRIPVTIDASAFDVDGAPVVVDVDFRAELDAIGSSAPFEPDSLRVVLADCGGLGTIELPSQFLDDWVALLDQADPTDPTGDQAGSVAFLYDEDGDYSTLETLAANGSAEVHLYFGSGITAPSYSTDLAPTASTLTNDSTEATFDSGQGGLMTALTSGSSASLWSSTAQFSGNGFFGSGAGWIGAHNHPSGSSSLDLLETGPVVAVMQASGNRVAAGIAGYDYSYTFVQFAGRPEVWVKVHFATSIESTVQQNPEWPFGIRPWQGRHIALGAGTFTDDSGLTWNHASDGSFGLGTAWSRPPANVVSMLHLAPAGHVALGANDVGGAGVGTNVGVIPAGTDFVDHAVLFVLPHAGVYADVADTMDGLMAGTSTVSGAAEAL